MAQSVKWSLFGREDLSSEFQNSDAARRRDQRQANPRCLLANQSSQKKKKQAPSSVRNPTSKKMERADRRRYPMLTSDFHKHTRTHTCMHACTYTHTIHINTKYIHFLRYRLEIL